MKWIITLLSLCVLSSCSTKPYMVGSVNEMFYKRYMTPGKRWYKRSKEIQTYAAEAPPAAPYTSSK
ncbi:hypothetical protein [Prosthecobacter debontii]|nr:hypothetical protein [Prosthecobacter debontii]